MDESSRDRSVERLTSSTLDNELRLVDEAIAAVATGGFPSVTVAGLRFGDELLDHARRAAEPIGLRIRPLFHTGEHGSDLVVERVPGDETDQTPEAVR